MKFPLGFGLCCLLAAGAVAQHRGGGGAGHAVSAGGGARVGFTSGVRGGGRIGYRPRYGNFGYRGFRGYYRSYRGSYWPWFYGYPGFWDSSNYYDSGYPYGASYENAPNVTVVYAPPAEPVYQTIVTAHPVIHEYRQPEDYGLPSEHASPVLYLIAFNDHVIRAATTYWVENDKLRYLDTDHKQKEAPLSSVDRNFSAELNRERHVPFHLQ